MSGTQIIGMIGLVAIVGYAVVDICVAEWRHRRKQGRS